jgi:hypothetical protein
MFKLKRGDSVLLNLLNKDGTKVEVFTGLLITENEVRRDSDGSIFSFDENGKKVNINGQQFLQVTKIFDSVVLTKGKSISLIHVDNSNIELTNTTIVSVFDSKGEQIEHVEIWQGEDVTFNYMSNPIYTKLDAEQT